MNVEDRENPELHKFRKLVTCFVIHTAKERKFRVNFNAARSSNVITFSLSDCIGLQSCFVSFYRAPDITKRNRCSLFLWWFLLLVLQVGIEGVFLSSYVSPTSYMLLSKPVAEFKFHNFHYSTYILLIKSSCSTMSAKDILLFQKGDPYVEQLKEAWSSYSSWVSLVTHDTEIYYAHKAFILILFFSFVSSFVRVGLACWILIFLLFCVF